MKILTIQPAFITASALSLVLAVRAQQNPAGQKQPANPPTAASGSQPASESPQPKQPASQPPAGRDKKQTTTTSKAEEPVTQAAAAAEGRKPLLSQPESPALTERNLPGTIYAAKGIEQRTARAIAGRKVRGSDGKDLGKVKDILVDQYSGDISYAVVSSGGIGIRDQLHLVPFKALKTDGKDKGEFTVPMNQAEWQKLGRLDEAEFKSGRLTVSDGERRELAQRFERAQSGEAASGSAFYLQAISSYLIRADEIRGSDVFMAGRKVGTIEDVIVDHDAATASAIFDPSSHFTTAKAKFVVPLNRYSFGTTKGERVTTMLSRPDFEQMRTIAHEAPAVAALPRPATSGQSSASTSGAAPAGTGPKAPSPPITPAQSQAASAAPALTKSAATDPKTIAADQRPATGATTPTGTPVAAGTGQPWKKNQPGLAPTGRTTPDPKQSTPAPASLPAAKAIRAMLDREAASVARIEVNVNSENGSIVLRGSVPDEPLKKSIEEKAAQAAQGARIDSQIAVEKK